MDQRLEKIYNQIPKPDLLCPPNCGDCCGILYPSQAEIRNIKEWLAIRNREYIDFLFVDADVTCPYLDEYKRCSIYPVRPFLCRLLAATIDLPCPHRLCRTTKPLNPAQSTALYKEVYLKGKQKPLTEKHRELLRPIIRPLLHELANSKAKRGL